MIRFVLDLLEITEHRDPCRMRLWKVILVALSLWAFTQILVLSVVPTLNEIWYSLK